MRWRLGLSVAVAFGAAACGPRARQVERPPVDAAHEGRPDAAPLVGSDTAFLLAIPGLAPENIAYDAAADMFHVGSVGLGRVYGVDRSGRTTVIAGGGEPLGRILGLRLDAAKRSLWLATFDRDTAIATRGRPRAALIEVDVAHRTVRRRLSPPDSGRGHLFNDLALSRHGDIFVTDSDAGVVYRLRAGARALEPWYRPRARAFTYPNGLALSADEHLLYVAHEEGITIIDVRTARGRLLSPTHGSTLTGIDGLYVTGRRLIGVQNGPGSEQVIGATLDGSGHCIGAVRVLERRHPAYDTPTTGVVVGDTLFYLANSQLRRFATGHATASRDTTVVLRLPLPPAMPAGADGASCTH
jgi:hypothetical protein